MFNSSMILGIAGFVIGALNDFVKDKQMKVEIEKTVEKLLEQKLGGQ